MNLRPNTLLAAVMCAVAASAQSVDFSADDNAQRGWYDRPYLRYEAEPGFCETDAELLTPPDEYSQTPLQSEASNFRAVTLSAAGQSIKWTADADADALTLRFSLPDGDDGMGLESSLVLLVNGSRICDIALDSYWAWQWIPRGSQSKHPDNIPSDSKFARMRFDEVHRLLPSEIRKGDTFELIKESDDGVPCTVDFVELEKAPAAVSFEDIEGDKVLYDGDGSTLQSVINQNPGKTIYLPEGEYRVARRLTIPADNTRLVGAGSWRTLIYFSADPANRRTYSLRGIESDASGTVLQGFAMNSASNIRYFDNNENYGIGKGLQGSFGKNSVIRDLRIEHFECGAWIADYAGKASDGLVMEYCRIRNNYADGINLCSGSRNARVRHCSFRNNGDDDMASWSTGNETSGIEFSYCTAEHNWRASSLAFFGGRDNSAHHIAVHHGMESGVRVTADFQGTGFASDGRTTIRHINIHSCGCKAGGQGTQGDFWGAGQPALLVSAGYWYDIDNLTLKDIDIRNSRNMAIAFRCSSNHRINNIEIHNVLIDGVDGNGTPFSIPNNVAGNGHYSGIRFENIDGPGMSTRFPNFDFTEAEAGISNAAATGVEVTHSGNDITISGLRHKSVLQVYDLAGRLLRQLTVPAGEFTFSPGRGSAFLRLNDQCIRL